MLLGINCVFIVITVKSLPADLCTHSFGILTDLEFQANVNRFCTIILFPGFRIISVGWQAECYIIDPSAVAESRQEVAKCRLIAARYVVQTNRKITMRLRDRNYTYFERGK